MRKTTNLFMVITSIVLMCSLLTGCASSTETPVQAVITGETISKDSKWINSSIEGAIDENTVTNVKDDFYTAINRDWLLETDLEEGQSSVDFATNCEEIQDQRKLGIINGETNNAGAENPAGIDEELLSHNRELLGDFAALAGNWDERNELGVEPLRECIEEIQQISSLDQMNKFILDDDGMNFDFYNLTAMGVMQPLDSDEETYTVGVLPQPSLTLRSQDEYSNIDATGQFYKECTDQEISYLADRLGYSDTDISDVVTDCYKFEIKLAGAIKSQEKQNSVDYLKEANNIYTLDAIGEIEGNYPLTEMIGKFGLEESDSYMVAEPEYIESLGKIYSERNLEEIKAYYIVHTMTSMMSLLDWESFNKYRVIERKISAKEQEETTTGPDTQETDDGDDGGLSEKEKQDKILLNFFVREYLNEPMDQLYISEYCSSKEKAQLINLISEILSYYRVMLSEEDWLSEKARETAIDKLDNIAVNVLYPDTFTDYSTLDLSECNSVPEAVARINGFKELKETNMVNQQVNRNRWDLDEVPTTTINAFYNPQNNSINIMAGIMADGILYNEDMSYEEILGKIGVIVGHEVTHAFDYTGCYFDKDGNYVSNSWFEISDLTRFQIRASKLQNYYNVLTPYPGATSYDGVTVQSEAIADMGGLKCMLGLAEDRADFDYKEFFEAYADLWKTKDTYAYEIGMASNEHPLAMLRANVTVQQFEEFMDTYDIQPGDGMYLATDDRIAVW